MRSDRINSERRQRNYLNYGEKLYQRGMRRMYEMDAFIKRAKSEQDKAEVEAYSFKPEINNISRMIVRDSYEKTEDFLMKYGRAVRDKINHQRVLNLRNELNHISFKPKISKTSEKIVAQKQAANLNHGYTKYDSLYEDALRRKERQEFIYSACIEAECTF